MDVFTPQKRSKVMSRIRGRDTKPELTLRSMLHRLDYRFTVNGPKNKSLPGKPDLVLPKHRTVIFVHGCFKFSPATLSPMAFDTTDAQIEELCRMDLTQ